MIMKIPLSIVLPTLLLCVVIISVRTAKTTKYNICNADGANCQSVNYRSGDSSKGALSRAICGMKGGDANREWSAVYCEGTSTSCTPYTFFGRDDFNISFKRHIMCIRLCSLITRAQLTTSGPIKLCSATKKDCLEVSRVNESFNAFNRCAFQCDGWTTAANSKQLSINVCNVNDECVTGSYFTKPKSKNSFESLKACIVNCMPTDALDKETIVEEKVRDPNEVHAKNSTEYQICNEQKVDCEVVHYRLGDKSKGDLCRVACGTSGGDLNKQWQAVYCERGPDSCTPYTFSGRDDFTMSFARHLMCVRMCTFVAEAQHNTAGPIELCSSEKTNCLTVPRVDDKFDAFNQCAFGCDGWKTLENTEEQSTTVCNVNGVCVKGSFYTKPNAENALDGLKTCFKNCMPPSDRDMMTGDEDEVQVPNEE